jgi:GTP-binding protein HflX
MSTRLVRGWTHLERQKGGIGMRGPGETQLETDRRLLGQRIKSLKKRLGKVQSQREQGRRSRQRANIPVVSLVGYTNMGKSTLFNKLTSAEVYADDRLFATLDPTLRRMKLIDTQPLVMADTVGFIRKLPHDLVESFSSTLDETRDAALLLHIVEAGASDRDDLIAHVNDVLHQIGADDVPQLIICNKIDQLDNHSARLDRDENGRINRVWLSAVTGEGLDLLRQALKEYFPEHKDMELVD